MLQASFDCRFVHQQYIFFHSENAVKKFASILYKPVNENGL